MRRYGTPNLTSYDLVKAFAVVTMLVLTWYWLE